ncbi:MAG: glycogen synthase GlgA [Bacteroidota bacterium]
MNVCFASSECAPYAKTGGLADVAGSLPKALQEEGCHVKVFMPLYGSINTIDHNLTFCEDLGYIPVEFAGKVVGFYTWYGTLPGSDAEIYFVDCPTYYHRPSLYNGANRDEDERFIFLQHAVFRIMQHYGWSPDVIHCNDWHTALMPAMVKEVYGWDRLFQKTGSLLSIHNIGYQGLFSGMSVGKAGLDPGTFYPGSALEKDGAFSFLKTGIAYADIVSTVSRTYGYELMTQEFGAGLDGLLRARASDFEGVVNGIDVDVWNPETDPYISKTYSADALEGKEANKRALLAEVGLPYDPSVPVVGIVSRFTSQKGFELLFPIMDGLLQSGPVQFVVLGSGERRIEDFFRRAAGAYPHLVSANIRYDEGLAHRITAGSDYFLMPSNYEPCGMNQMFSLRYGTVPVVRKTGGLADTVRDFHEFDGAGNGISFVDFSPHALFVTLRRALTLYRQPSVWDEMRVRGMKEDFSWTRSAQRYIDLYRRAQAKR